MPVIYKSLWLSNNKTPKKSILWGVFVSNNEMIVYSKMIYFDFFPFLSSHYTTNNKYDNTEKQYNFTKAGFIQFKPKFCLNNKYAKYITN